MLQVNQKWFTFICETKNAEFQIWENRCKSFFHICVHCNVLVINAHFTFYCKCIFYRCTLFNTCIFKYAFFCNVCIFRCTYTKYIFLCKYYKYYEPMIQWPINKDLLHLLYFWMNQQIRMYYKMLIIFYMSDSRQSPSSKL